MHMIIYTVFSKAANFFQPVIKNIRSRKIQSWNTRKVPLVNRLRQEIESARLTCSQSTTTNRITAVNALERFLREAMPGQAGMTAEAMTAEHVKAFERWALDNGNKPGYVALHMRNLRALTKRIRDDGSELFRLVRTSNCQAGKKAVSEETIRKIRQMPAASPGDALARDVFLFCFYGMGIPLIDAVHMKKSQLRDGYITYYRHKTHRKVKVEVVPELREILERLTPNDSPYLLPVLTTEDNAGARRLYRSFYQKYSRSLARLSHRIGMETRITSYTPRHSWASIAYRNSIDLNTIARALGHANTNVTMTYIREIEDSQLGSANRIVCDAIQ